MKLKWLGFVMLGWACAFNAQADKAVRGLPPPADPPSEFAEYFRKVQEAERIQDDEHRCRTYPDLPGNAWPAGAGRARCPLLRDVSLDLDKVASILAREGGMDELEKLLREMLVAREHAPEQGEDIYRFYSQFDSGTKAAGVVREWIRKAPDSPFALTALGKQRASQGWAARGGAFLNKTSPAQLRQMAQLFTAAHAPLSRALEIEPRLTPACLSLAEIGRQSSDALQSVAMVHCLEQDPNSYFLVWEWVTAAMPKWGGSMPSMTEVDDYIRLHGSENPMLYALLAESAGYRAIEHDTRLAALQNYVAGANAGPGSGMLGNAGIAYRIRNSEGDAWLAFVYLSQALRFMPSSALYREERGRALSALGHVEWAADDLATASAMNPTDMQLQFLAGFAAMVADRPIEARTHLERALALPELRGQAFEYLCQLHGTRGPTYDTAKWVGCTTELAEQHPNESGYWMWHFAALASAGHPDAKAVAQRVLDISAPGSEDHRTVKEYLERGNESP
jgi:tetratricopeptide (TPR) repeat protein